MNTVSPHRPRWLALLCSVALLCCFSGRAAEIRAGAAAANITPPIGIAMNGGTAPVISTHVHDELHARCLALDDGATRFAFVVVDNCLIERGLFDEAKQLVQRQTGLRPEQVLMSCTHTHSAGSATGVHLSEPDEAYRRWLPGRLADAVRRAVNNLAPARLAWGSGSVPQHVFCRRIRLKPGSRYQNQLGETNQLAKMNWDSPHPDDLEPAGPTDPELFVVSVQHLDGRPLALLANYSLHYVGETGAGHLSADYYGAFCDRIQQLFGANHQDPPFIAILCNGTSGDINNKDGRAEPKQRAPYEQIRLVANDVLTEVQRVMRGLSYRSDVTLKFATRELKVATRKPSTAEVERARGLVQGRSAKELKTWPEIYAREQLILADFPDEVSLPLQVFRLGDLGIAAWPAEIFAVTGLELKRRSPVKPVFNIGLANGWYGYVPPPEQHRLGAYETWRGRTSFLEVSATTRITGALLDLLEQVK